jgi:hypothetical protein
MSKNPAFQAERDLAAAMAGADFPATRDQLVERARQNGAPKEVIERFSRLPDRTYDNVAQVMDASNES